MIGRRCHDRGIGRAAARARTDASAEVLHPRRHLRRPASHDCGSAVLLMLFVCAVIAVVVHALSAVILCVEGALVDETRGRVLLAEKDAALAHIRQGLLCSWGPVGPTWTTLETSSTGESVEVTAMERPDSGGWVMGASVRHEPDVSRWRVSVAAEYGRDGVDLPQAAIVAGSLSAAAGREILWLDLDPAAESDGGAAVLCYTRELLDEPLLGPMCAMLSLNSPWRLDPGWASAATVDDESAGGSGIDRTPDASASPSAVVPGPQAYLLAGDRGTTMRFPVEAVGGSSDVPHLVVLTGGADLDATHLGDFYGVIVVDGGSSALEGTVVHGAVFTTDEVTLGESGCILYSPRILRWATDRSLQRVRLVPGTRWEAVE